MSNKVSFINGATSYNDEDVAQLQTDFMSEGVADTTGSGTDCQISQRATGGANMSVDIAIGRVYIDITLESRNFKVRFSNLAIANAVVTANTTGGNRIDAALVVIDNTVTPSVTGDNIGTLSVLPNTTGTPTVAISDGDITTLLGHANWYRLANITVANGATSITNANITDTRQAVAWKNVFSVFEMIEQAANPAAVANRGKTYTKDVAGRTELHYLDNAGNVIRLTNNGSVNVSAADEKVKISNTDTTSGYLLDKIIGGTGFTISQENPSGNEQLKIEYTPPTASVNPQTGTTYTLALTDAGDVITLANAGNVFVKVPLNADVAFPVGSIIRLIRYGAGAVCVFGDAGVTIYGELGYNAIAETYAGVDLIKIATNTWEVIGRLKLSACGFGYFAGGGTGSYGSTAVATADRLTFSTGATAASTVSNLSSARIGLAAVSDKATYGYFAGGSVGAGSSIVTTADRLTFSTGATAANTASNLSQARWDVAGVSDVATYGYFAGGSTSATSGYSPVTTADRLTFSTGATAANTASRLSVARMGVAGISDGATYGYFAGGATNQTSSSVVTDRLTFSSGATAANTTSNLSAGRMELAGISDGATYGYFAGGATAAQDVTVATADRLTFSTGATAANTASNLSGGRVGLAGVSNSATCGYFVGGGSPATVLATADIIRFATGVSSANTTSNLSQARYNVAGLSPLI